MRRILELIRAIAVDLDGEMYTISFGSFPFRHLRIVREGYVQEWEAETWDELVAAVKGRPWRTTS
jgi:hypothetical protein